MWEIGRRVYETVTVFLVRAVRADSCRRQLVGDFDPQMAPLLLSYGKALYELAFSQQGVMGKEEVAKETEPARE